MIIDQIKWNFKQAQEVLERFISDPKTWEKLEKAGELMVRALKSGNKIISCGNSGSMCDVEIRVPHNGYSDCIQEIHIKVIHSLVNTSN